MKLSLLRTRRTSTLCHCIVSVLPSLWRHQLHISWWPISGGHHHLHTNFSRDWLTTRVHCLLRCLLILLTLSPFRHWACSDSVAIVLFKSFLHINPVLMNSNQKLCRWPAGDEGKKQAGMPVTLFSAPWQNVWQKIAWGRRVCLGSQLKVKSILSIISTGSWGSWSRCIPGQEQRERWLLVPNLCYFYSV